MEDLHVEALISSYWYYASLLPYAASEVDRMNLTNLIERVAQRIADIKDENGHLSEK